jgi:hypothetical protein
MTTSALPGSLDGVVFVGTRDVEEVEVDAAANESRKQR